MLLKKMVRDIWAHKGSYLSCLLIAVIGLAVYTSLSIASSNLGLSQEVFYREQNFADGFIELQAMPESEVDKLRDTEGILAINGRLVQEVRYYDPQREDSVFLRLVSVDPFDTRRVNDVRWLAGEDDLSRELAAGIDSQFFAANRLELGQDIEIIAAGRLRKLTLAGVGMSPEFTYPLRTPTQIYPEYDRFGIAFLSLDSMYSLFPTKEGLVNDLVFTLEPGAGFEEVRQRLEPELEQYGLKTIYPRDDQISHLILSEEIAQLDRVATAFPLLFLSIAAIILLIMLKRLVEQQRVQIGILKAFGYTSREILYHYLSYALALGVVSGFLGGILGILLTRPLSDLLLEFFNVPQVFEGFSLFYFLAGILLSLAVFLLAGYQGSRLALQLQPTDAMRPPVPVSGKKTPLERITPFVSMLTIQGKMALRNTARNKSRSFFIFLGIMLGSSLVALTWSFNDMIDKLIFYHFQDVQTYDARMSLYQPLDRDQVLQELEGYPQLTRIEPVLEIPAKLSRDWREADISLMGLTGESRLYNILDADGKKLDPPDQGIVLSERLAEKLGVQPGSKLVMESPLFRDADAEVLIRVTEVIPQYVGMGAYMNLSHLEEVLGQGETANSFLLLIDNKADITGEIISIRHDYQESALVAGVEGREEQIKQASDLIESFGIVLYIYVFVGIILCFAIIYSSSFIILSERSYEMASMRVLGMTSEEVFSVITFEQWFLSLFAILAGLPLAQIMQQAMAREMSTDLYSIPGTVSMEAMFVAVVFTAFSIWLAQRFALSRVKNLSLVEALKQPD